MTQDPSYYYKTDELSGKLFCSMKDMQRALDIGHTKSYDIVNKGLIKTVKIGSHRKVEVASLRQYVTSLVEAIRVA